MSPSRLIKVVVYADFMCPYSYISHKSLFDAIAECSNDPLTFNVEYRPFRLNSTLSEDIPVDRRLYFSTKYEQKYEAMLQFIQRIASDMNLTITADGLLSQSTRAHRLSVKAYQVGGQEMQQAVLLAYFKAYFHEGNDIGNLDVLGDIAQNAGLMGKEQTIDFLKTDELSNEVERTIAEAHQKGIKGSPATIIDDKFKLDGVHMKDTFVQVFKRLGKCADAMAAGSPCSDTSSDGTISPSGRTA